MAEAPVQSSRSHRDMGVVNRWRRLSHDSATIRRLVVADFALVLAALLAVVAIGDPGDRGRLPVGGWTGEASDGRMLERSERSERSGRLEARGELGAPGATGAPPAAPVPLAPSGEAGSSGRGPSATPANPAPGSGGGAQAVRSGATAPPADGLYRYRVTASSDTGEEEEHEAETHYTTTSRSDAETRQTVEGDDGSSFMTPGFGGAQTHIWRADGLYAEQAPAEEDDFGGSSCEPAEQLVVRLPLAAGEQWRTRMDCSFGFGPGFGGTMHSESTSRVVGSTVIDVAGARVAVWEIHTTTHATGEFSGEEGSERFEATVEQVQFFAPSLGRFVRGHGTYRGTSSDGDETGSFRVEALNLDPE